MPLLKYVGIPIKILKLLTKVGTSSINCSEDRSLHLPQLLSFRFTSVLDNQGRAGLRIFFENSGKPLNDHDGTESVTAGSRITTVSASIRNICRRNSRSRLDNLQDGVCATDFRAQPLNSHLIQLRCSQDVCFLSLPLLPTGAQANQITNFKRIKCKSEIIAASPFASAR